MRRTVFVLLGLLAVLVSGCGSTLRANDPVFLVATSVSADAGFVAYEHASGVFRLRMPPHWIAGELPDSHGVRVQFTSLEDTLAVTRLSVYVVNTGTPMTPEAFAQAVTAYQPPQDVANYAWQELSRADQRDGSRRLTGVRTYPALGERTLNIFLQGDGTFFSALEVDVTEAPPPVLEALTAVVNTFRVDPAVDLAVGAVQQAAAGITSYSGVIAFHGYTAWTDRTGVFHLTGEAVNTTPYPLEAVRLSGVLFDEQGRRLVEQPDILAVDVLGPGQGAPFDLRFEGGKPASAVRYELHIAGREADYALRAYYGPENFAIANDSADYSPQGHLVVRGELANVGPYAAEAIKVVAAIWDGSGQVVGAETVFISKSQLVPQEAAPFEVAFYELGGPALTYTLTVLGTVAGAGAG